jgi:thioesterase domain-containing protein
MSVDLDPVTATAFVHQSVPAMARMGLVVEAIQPGLVRLLMPLEPNRNHIGTMYAGALFAIAELPGGVLPLSVLGVGFVPIVTHLEIDFRRAVRSDVRLVARMEPAELQLLGRQAQLAGKAEFELDLTIVDDSGAQVAASHGVYQLRRID